MSSKHWSQEEIGKLVAFRTDGLTWSEISEAMGISANCARKAFYRYTRDGVKPMGEKTGPKILLLDIETAPMAAYTWGMFNQNFGLDQIILHSSILSWSAKWLGAPEHTIMYQDVRNEDDIRNDKNILYQLWSLLDEADCVITQNGVKFDIPKINSRLAVHKFKSYSSFKNIDTLRIAKSVFGFDSNKLAHLTDLFCTKYKKLDHSEYPGFSLWKACLEGDIKAFQVMERYNKYDVMSLEELYIEHLMPWDNSVNFAAWSDEYKFRCNCGNDEFKKSGFHVTKRAKYQKHRCTKCGKEHRDSTNLFSKERRTELKV